MQDVVDPVKDEMLANFVVDSHFRSQPKGANLDEQAAANSQEDLSPSARPIDPEVPSSELQILFLFLSSI